ncbi:hypothetical protein HK101_006754 [Irineochytrium annulatum]|nr:hypothetical protein HK101_006754 [Irineochytrium annulatum]
MRADTTRTPGDKKKAGRSEASRPRRLLLALAQRADMDSEMERSLFREVTSINESEDVEMEADDDSDEDFLECERNSKIYQARDE